MTATPQHSGAIAIVGMAGHFPAARDISELWALLKDGREATTWLSDADLMAAGVSTEELSDAAYVKAAMILDDVENFDAEFFGFSPREAAILDPQHRHFLECCWEALEDAGRPPSAFAGAIGVFGGCGSQTYFARNLLPNAELVRSVGHFLLRHTGNDKDFLTTRVSYLLNLKGPSVGIQTACSTSLVAVHMACQSLHTGECDMALAGGASIELPHRTGYIAAEGEILSPTGHCAAFDNRAAGTIFGSGAGVVVLRRLEDALADGDNIHAVILGSAVNNDGAGKAGYFAPSVDGQASAAAEAIAVAGVEPSSISYIEAHGTGTVIGDPIELAALQDVYAAGTTRGAIGVGSIKTNIGHLDTAAGVASLIKVVLALKHETIPASLNFSEPNRRFNFPESPFSVVASARSWPKSNMPRRASVNSLGVGGTNAHLVVEEASLDAAPEETSRWQLFTLSAKTPSALKSLSQKWRDFAATANPTVALADAAFTTHVGREAFQHRLSVVARTEVELAAGLTSAKSRRQSFGAISQTPPSVVFMFPGGGAQYPGCARDLYQENAVFHDAADRCFVHVPSDLADLKSVMFGDASLLPDAAQRLAHPLYSILAVLIIEVALASMWQSFGVLPAAVIGNSAGDYAAAVIAGVLSLEDAIKIVVWRGEIFAAMPPGAMLAVHLPEDRLRELAGAELDVAVLSAPELGVISGDVDGIERVRARLDADGVDYSRVRIDVAAHSRMLNPFLSAFRMRLESVRFSDPKVPFMSCLTGGWAEKNEVSTPDYWVQQLRNTVRFSHGMSALLEEPGRVFLEVGPGKSLTPLAGLATAKHAPHAIVASTRGAIEADDDVAVATLAVGQLWAAGVDVDLAAVRGPRQCRLVSVPTYAFDRQRHWIDPPLIQISSSPTPAQVSQPVADAVAVKRLPNVDGWFQTPIWRERTLPPPALVPSDRGAATALIFSDRSPLAEALIAALKRRGSNALVVEVNDSLSLDGASVWSIDPTNEEHYTKLLEALASRGVEASEIFHLWSLLANSRSGGNGNAMRLATSFDSLFLLMRAIQLADCSAGLRILCVTTGAVAVAQDIVTHPLNATLLGAVRVWGREAEGSTAQLIDIVSAVGDEGRIAGQIVAESEAGSSDNLVALRGTLRHVLRFERASQVEPKQTSGRILNDGVYIITGGTGSLGLLLARYLITTHGARVALISRRENAVALPTELLNGAIIIVADVTDEAAMARAITETRVRFGKIDGVIHAAGIVNDAPIGAKTLSDTHRVLAPKVTGGLILDRLLPPGTISLFAVFSSTSALLGPPGQIDYVAANAFLDALAASRSDGLAIDWGIWGDIGMAARPLLADDSAPAGRGLQPGNHPLLGALQSQTGSERLFESVLDPNILWVLSEHVIAEIPVLPGTAYLECVRAAMTWVGPAARYAFTSVAFLSPLRAVRGTKHRLRTRVQEIGADLWTVVISSLSEGSAQEDLHFRCEATILESVSQPRPTEMDRTTSRPGGDFIAQSSILSLGPRWKNIKSIEVGPNSVQATLELDPQYASDLNLFGLHPALLDMAMTIGLHLASEEERANYLFVPARIGSVEFMRPLVDHVAAISRITSRETNKSITFSVSITAPDGATLVTLSELEMRAVDRNAFVSAALDAARPSQNPLAALLAAGLRAGDAPNLFARAFGAGPARVVVSSIALSELERLYAKRGQTAVQSKKVILKVAAEMTETEQKIAAMFTDLLGVADVQPDDGFLALGGHSLAAVRLFAKIRKQTGVDLGIASLFQAPSVRELARLIDDSTAASQPTMNAAPISAQPQAVGDDASTARRNGHAQNGRSSSAWSPLVRISNGQPGSRPLFWVHGAAGNVISINPLADHLRKRHALYGLQAHGVDGRIAPQEKIEDMAASYAAAIREADPDGPYCLLGYSGGGVIAYEMAQQLRASGYEIAMLAMIDTLAPSSSGGASLFDWLKYGWDWGPTKLALQARSGARWRLDNLANRWFPTKYEGRTVDPILANADRVFAGYLRAQGRYYTLPYPGEILLFRAKNPGVGFYAAGDMLGWGGYVKNRVEVHEVDATHETIVHKPSIDNIARVLDAKLQAINSNALRT